MLCSWAKTALLARKPIYFWKNLGLYHKKEPNLSKISSHLAQLGAFSPPQRFVLRASVPSLVICYPNMIYVRVLELFSALFIHVRAAGVVT